MFLGAHESISGGVHTAFERAAERGCECLQIFTRNQQQWKAAPVTRAEVASFQAESRERGIPLERVMVHNSYLVNLASPDRDKLRQSRRAMLAELRRCQLLGIGLLNFHPGAHVGCGEEEGLARVIDSLDHLLEKTAGSPVRLVLETTAGQGSCLGHRFEHLRTILDGVADPARIAVCLDTAHIFAAGYDLSSEAGYQAVMAEFDSVIGLDRLVAFHLNDSKVGLGSRVDRHEAIGKGKIGPAAFRRLVNDPRHHEAIGVLELPEKLLTANLKRLRRYRTSKPAAAAS
jgi:deoxyribonuclease-4